MLLELHGLRAGYGKKQVLSGVNLGVRAGEIVALIGHNGAGKSTTLKAVLGLLPTGGGDIRFDGQPIERRSVTRHVETGISLVPQGRFVFSDLPVGENLEVAAFVLRVRAEEIRRRMTAVFDLFPALAQKRRELAGALSGGQQQMLAIGMALMQKPRLLLLDEPSIGLAPVLVQQVMASVVSIRDSFKTAVLIVEQNVRQVLRVSERVYVMKLGQIVLEAPSAELLARQDLWDLF
jgi:branched-chain amino acid transport system ATP-binding protein